MPRSRRSTPKLRQQCWRPRGHPILIGFSTKNVAGHDQLRAAGTRDEQTSRRAVTMLITSIRSSLITSCRRQVQPLPPDR